MPLVDGLWIKNPGEFNLAVAAFERDQMDERIKSKPAIAKGSSAIWAWKNLSRRRRMLTNYIGYINVTPDHFGDCHDIIEKQKSILEKYINSHGGSILSTVIEPLSKSFVLVKLPYAIALCQAKGADLLIASCDVLGRECDVTYKMLKYFVGITSCNSEGECSVCRVYQQA